MKIDRAQKWVDDLTRLLTDNDVMEYESIWNTFQAVGLALAGKHDVAEQSFAKALTVAGERGDRLFLPETLRYRALFFSAIGKQREGEGDWVIAREIAKQMDAQLYISRLESPSSASAPWVTE